MASNKENNAKIYAQVRELLKGVVLEQDVNHENDNFIFISMQDEEGGVSSMGSERGFAHSFLQMSELPDMCNAMLITAGFVAQTKNPIVDLLTKIVGGEPSEDKDCDCAICTRKRQERADRIANNPNIN